MPENCSCVFSENAVRWVYEIKGVGRLSYAGLRCAGENIRLYRRRVSAGTGTGRCAGVPQVLRAEPLRQITVCFRSARQMSGTVEEMTAVMQRYKTALVLMIETTPFDYRDTAEQKNCKKAPELVDGTAYGKDAGGWSDRPSDDGGRTLEACALHVSLLCGRAENGRRCPHEMLGKRWKNSLFFSDPVLTRADRDACPYKQASEIAA